MLLKLTAGSYTGIYSQVLVNVLMVNTNTNGRTRNTLHSDANYLIPAKYARLFSPLGI